MKRCGKSRLSVMMALVYSVQGAFWPLLAVHLEDLGITGRSRGWIFATMAMGSLMVPLGVGQLVDRMMATQRFLALAFGSGTGLLALLASGLVVRDGPLFVLFLAFWSILAPCYGLCNSLAMRHLEDPPRDFGRVRLWGTVGWMAAGWLVTLVMVGTGSARGSAGAYEAFAVATLLSLAFSGYSLTLPGTPPLAVGEGCGASLREGLGLVRRPEVAVLLVTSFALALTTPMVYQVMPGYLEARGLTRAWTSTAMTLGQWPEVASLALLPWLLRRLGYRGTMAVGLVAWLARFLGLAAGPPLWLAVAGGMLHGVGVGCFTVTAQVYLDSRASARHRAGAQALYLMLTNGLGSLFGSLLAGELAGRSGGAGPGVFLVPCVIIGALLVYFMTGFRSHDSTVDGSGAATADLPLRPHPVRGTVACVGNFVTESADG